MLASCYLLVGALISWMFLGAIQLRSRRRRITLGAATTALWGPGVVLGVLLWHPRTRPLVIRIVMGKGWA